MRIYQNFLGSQELTIYLKRCLQILQATWVTSAPSPKSLLRTHTYVQPWPWHSTAVWTNWSVGLACRETRMEDLKPVDLRNSWRNWGHIYLKEEKNREYGRAFMCKRDFIYSVRPWSQIWEKRAELRGRRFWFHNNVPVAVWDDTECLRNESVPYYEDSI